MGAAAAAWRSEGLAAYSQRRKQDSRERLLAAAVETFCAEGYVGVSVEEIAAAAGLSRITFYRHFSCKVDLAVEVFRGAAGAAMPRFLAIREAGALDGPAIRSWIAQLFASDRLNRRLLRAFTQAAGVDPDFTEQAQALITDIIAGLGEGVPAFAIDPDEPGDRRRWLEAWLLIYEILDQSNHSALESGIAGDPLVIDILADRFLGFIRAAH